MTITIPLQVLWFLLGFFTCVSVAIIFGMISKRRKKVDKDFEINDEDKY